MSFVSIHSIKIIILLGLVFVIGVSSAKADDLDNSPAQISVSADSVFSIMTEAWRSGDEKSMAALSHPDGLRVTHGGDYDRFTFYSPDQAFYYFQDLFRSRTTQEFKFRRLNDSPDGGQSLAMVDWVYLLPGRKLADEIKLVLVLTLKDRHWYLAQINSISQR